MLYEDNFLIERIFDKLEGKAPKKFKLSKPEVERKNRKTFMANFGMICTELNRDQEMIREYFEKELGKKQEDVTVSASQVLTITGSYNEIDMANVIRNFANKYVLCMEPKCKSGNTELIKENRITYMQCHTCNCKTALKL